MTRTLIHHTDDADFDPTALNPRREKFDLCLTDSRDVAGYGDYAYEVTVDAALASPEQVVEIADEHGLNREGPNRITADSPFFYLLADEPNVQRAVAKDFDGIRYEDEDWDNSPHECYRIFNPDCIIS